MRHAEVRSTQEKCFVVSDEMSNVSGFTTMNTNAAVLDMPCPNSRQFASSNPLVVVIEDDYRSALALAMLLDDWGYAYVTARSVKEAVQTLGPRLTRVAAIITDLNLDGELRGISDAAALASAIGYKVPTIVTTGYGDEICKTTALPVLKKPFDPNMLRSWLDFKLWR